MSISEQIDLATITKVVLTHLHFDHAGGLALLPCSVPVVVHRRSGKRATTPSAFAYPRASMRRARRHAPGIARPAMTALTMPPTMNSVKP